MILVLGTKTPALLQLCAIRWALLYKTLTHEKVATSLNIQGMHKDSFNELVESDYKLIWLLEHCMMGR